MMLRAQGRTAILLLAVFLAVGWASAAASQPRESLPDELLVAPKPGLSRAATEALYRRFGAELIEVLPRINVHRIRVAPEALEAVEQALRQHPHVEFVERNGLLRLEATPNDTLYPSQWHLPQIAAPAAWDLTNGSASVTVAIVDTGVDATHEDLASKMVPGFNAYNNNTDTSDVYGHGTQVAGSAAAISNNGAGVASPAWLNPIMPIRITDASLTVLYSVVASGMTWAVDHGAKVLNTSITGVQGSATVTSAADYARSQGALVVAAAGNCSCFDSTPANPSFISVAATTSSDTLASFSSRGAFVTVAAPGVGIYTTNRGGGYSAPSGTSVASPVAAGVVALIFSVNPSLSPSQAQSILQSTSLDLGTAGWDSSFGYGRINAHEAVVQAMTAPGDTTPPTASITSPANGSTVSGTATVQISAADDVSVARVELYVDGVLVATDTSAPYSIAWDTSTKPQTIAYRTGTRALGPAVTRSGPADGSHTLRAVAVDGSGNTGQSTAVSVSVQNAPDVTPPYVTITAPANGSTVPNKGNVKIDVTATDNVSVTLIELYIDGTLFGTSTSSPASFNWNVNGVSDGWHTLAALAYDAAGNSDSHFISVLKGSAGFAVSPSGDTSGGAAGDAMTAAISTPADGSVVSGLVTIEVSARGHAGVARVDLYVDGILTGSTTSAPYAFAWDTTDTGGGWHTIEARAVDGVGTSGWSTAVRVDVQN